jgi:hypothetical protein
MRPGKLNKKQIRKKPQIKFSTNQTHNLSDENKIIQWKAN